MMGSGWLSNTRSRLAVVHSPHRITGPRERVKAPTTTVTRGSVEISRTRAAAPLISTDFQPRRGMGIAPRPWTISNFPCEITHRCRNNTSATMAMETLASVLCITGFAPISDT